MATTPSSKNWYDAAADHMERLHLAQNWSDRAIIAAALERGVEVSKDTDRDRIVLTHDGRRHWWRDGLSSLNTRLAMRVAKNKDVLSALLLDRRLPVLRNQVFGEVDLERAWVWAQLFESVVIKPADATGGRLVFVDISTKNDFQRAFEAVAERTGRVLVEEFRSGTEYRFLVVRNKVIAVAQRRPACVIGDGKRTVAQLVEGKNSQRWRAPSHKKLRLGEPELEQLHADGRGGRTVPAEGEVIYLRSTSNIHTGGDAIDCTDTIDPEYFKIVQRAARALPGGVLLGFDVLLPAEGEGQLGIIEINTGPMISMHHLPWKGTARNAGGAIIEAMFPALRGEREIDHWVETDRDSARGCNDAKPPSVIERLRARASATLTREKS